MDLARRVLRARVRLEGPDALRDRLRHLDTPDQLHQTSTLYIQRGKDGYGKREELPVPESDMFRAELDLFAQTCRSGEANELSARNGNVALAVVYAGLRSIERQGQAVKLADVIADAHKKLAEGSRHVA